MSLALSIPWWLAVALVVMALVVGYAAYARPAVPLSGRRRALLTILRATALLLLLFYLLQPVASEPGTVRGAVVSVLLDNSRSMRLPVEPDGTTRRIDRSLTLIRDDIVPALSDRFEVELFGLDGEVRLAEGRTLEPSAERTDLANALRSVAERKDGRAVAGIVVLSDGGDTSGEQLSTVVDQGLPPVFAIDIGATTVSPDLEVTTLTAGEASIAGSVVELTAEVVRRGNMPRPIAVRLREGARILQVRHLTPTGQAVPVRTTFQVPVREDAATLYTVEAGPESDEVVIENNQRSVLVRPPARARRVLMVEGAPGFEHSFLKRVWVVDPGVDLDAVVRTGRDANGEHTFYVQGDPARTAALVSGYPIARADLFDYDAIVLANIESGFFRPDQLAMTKEFVADRGGGLLLLGSLSLSGEDLEGSPLEDLLPVELSDRGRAVSADGRDANRNRLRLTDDGAVHPIMTIGPTLQDTWTSWEAAPPLSGSVSLGSAKAGASVLALVGRPEGGASPLVAVQRYGRGRSMVFTGESAWRWKMMMPAESRLYGTFWGQAARWLTADAPDRVAVEVTSPSRLSGSAAVEAWVRDSGFRPVIDADVIAEVTTPGGGTRTQDMVLVDPETGRYRGAFPADTPGVYRLDVRARRDRSVLGSATDWVLVGGVDTEFVDPWSNNDVLRRIATGSGGSFLAGDDLTTLPQLIGAQAEPGVPVTRELWHGLWTFLLALTVLTSEWSLRRAWGMR